MTGEEDTVSPLRRASDHPPGSRFGNGKALWWAAGAVGLPHGQIRFLKVAGEPPGVKQ